MAKMDAPTRLFHSSAKIYAASLNQLKKVAALEKKKGCGTSKTKLRQHE
jgi:hypothetical protein